MTEYILDTKPPYILYDNITKFLARQPDQLKLGGAACTQAVAPDAVADLPVARRQEHHAPHTTGMHEGPFKPFVQTPFHFTVGVEE